MLAFLYQNLATILISLILLTLFVLAIVYLCRNRGACSCGGCNGCNGEGKCACCSARSVKRGPDKSQKK